jgi:hypothetical protein
MDSYSKVFVLSAFLLLLLPFPILLVNAASEDVTNSALTEAEETFASAYEAVLEAEQAGANVTELLDHYNLAVERLAEARILLRLGDFDDTINFVDLANIGADVKTEAEQLKIDAQESSNSNLLNVLTFSTLGVTFVICATFVCWRVFKRRYFRQPLEI